MLSKLEGATLQKTPLYEQVADLLESEIIRTLPQGCRLPSEQRLAETFQVSRTIIREALKLLKERSLIDCRTGSGAFVTKPEAQDISEVIARIVQMDKIEDSYIFDMRTVLEGATVRRAAQYGTEQDFSEMEQCLEKMKDHSLPAQERLEHDFQFHCLIARASRNPLLLLLMETVSNLLKDSMSPGILVAGGIDDGIFRHGIILEALRQHDVDLAESRMLEHLHYSQKNYETYVQQCE